MSGVVHKVKKVFKKVWDFAKPIVKVVAIAAAVYFTAGVALSYFGPTSAFAAAMPGFAGAAGAGTGIFSQAAAAIGLGGGLAQGAAAAAGSAGAAGAAAGAAGAAGSAASLGGDTLLEGLAGGATAAPAAATAAGAAGAGAGAATAAKAAMSLTDKLLLASTATSAISGLTSPTPKEIEAAKNSFYGSYYGMDKDGKTAAPTTAVSAPKPPAQPAPPQMPKSPGVIPTQPDISQPQAGIARVPMQNFGVPIGVNPSTPKLIPDVPT